MAKTKTLPVAVEEGVIPLATDCGLRLRVVDAFLFILFSVLKRLQKGAGWEVFPLL